VSHAVGVDSAYRSPRREGHVRPTIAKTFPLVEAAAAHAFIQRRENVGKVVLVV